MRDVGRQPEDSEAFGNWQARTDIREIGSDEKLRNPADVGSVPDAKPSLKQAGLFHFCWRDIVSGIRTGWGAT